jgi:hypothetical protein
VEPTSLLGTTGYLGRSGTSSYYDLFLGAANPQRAIVERTATRQHAPLRAAVDEYGHDGVASLRTVPAEA